MFSAKRSKTLIALGVGAVLPLGFAPVAAFWLVPFAYACLFFVWRGATAREAFWRGWVFGCGSFLTGIYWIYVSVHDFGAAPMLLAVVLTGGLVAVMALYSGAVGFVAARWFGTNGGWAWLGALPALWVLGEWWRGWFLTGFGWLSAGYSQTGSWLVGYAPIGGLLAVSWVVLILSGALVTVVCGRGRERKLAVLLLIALIGLARPLSSVRWTQPKGEFTTVALAQGAVPQDLKWQPEQLPLTLDLYERLTEEALGSELIIWPEAAIPDLYENRRDYLARIEQKAAAEGSTVMLGMLRYHRPTGTAQNALFVLGQPDAVYVKRHLVPYGEYFPVPGFVRSWMRAMQLPAVDTEPGEHGQPPLDVLGEQIAVTICYEDVFGAEQLHYFPAASLLVNVSNDAWFGDSIAAAQHLQIAQLRAAEAGRYLLRSTNTGLTAVIDPFGRVVARLPQFEAGVLKSSVQGFTGQTPYARWGNYAVVLASLAVLAIQLAITKLTIRPGT